MTAAEALNVLEVLVERWDPGARPVAAPVMDDIQQEPDTVDDEEMQARARALWNRVWGG